MVLLKTEQALEEACKHLKLGQWELAKAFLDAALDWKQITQDELVEFLLGVCVNPSESCCGSRTIPSPFHLSWLCLQYLETLDVTKYKEDVDLLKKDVAFKLLLSEASHMYDDIPYDELYRLFTKLYQPNSQARYNLVPAISSQLLTFLHDISNKDPFLFHYIQQMLKIGIRSPDPKGAEVVQELSAVWIKQKCQLLKENFNRLGQPNIAAATKQLLVQLSLFARDIELEDGQPHILSEEICQYLLELCLMGVLTKKDVYGALLSNCSALVNFCEVEDAVLNRKKPISFPLDAENFIDSIFTDGNTIRTKELFLRSFLNGQHFMESILNSLIILISANHYHHVMKCLNFPSMARLRPLVILLAWENIQTTTDAVELLNHLWPSTLVKDDFEPLLSQACDKLFGEAHLVQWCLEHCNDNAVGLGGPPLFRELCVSLKEHSVLCVLNKHLRLGKIDQKYVLEVLQTYTQVVDKKKEKLVRFVGDAGDRDTASGYISNDASVYQGYCIMFIVMQAVYQCVQLEALNKGKRLSKSSCSGLTIGRGAGEQDTNVSIKTVPLGSVEVMSEKFNAAKRLVGNLFPLEFRVAILENLFSLIFTTHDDLQEEDNSDTDESRDGEEWKADESDQHKILPAQESLDSLSHDSSNDSSHEINIDAGKQTRRLSRTISENTSSFSTCSSNSSSSMSGIGFLCSDAVIVEILSLVKDSTLELAMTLDKQPKPGPVFWKNNTDENVMLIQEKKLQKAVSLLKDYASDALWRFELISSSPSTNSSGLLQTSSKHHSIEVTPCRFYLSASEGGIKARRMKTSRTSALETQDSDVTSVSADIPGFHKGHKRSRSFFHLHRTGCCQSLSCHHQTVSCMLASKESLLNMCLLQSDDQKATQVIQMFSMERSDGALEMKFAKQYADLVIELKAFKIKQFPLSPALPVHASVGTETSLGRIAQAAAAGVISSSDSAAVDVALSKCTVPNIPEMYTLRIQHPDLESAKLNECKDLRVLVTGDLVLTACNNLESCSNLLSSIHKRMHSSTITDVEKKATSTDVDVKGLGKFFEQMSLLVAEIKKIQVSSCQFFPSVLLGHNSLVNILCQGIFPLNPSLYSKKYRWLERISNSLSEFVAAQQVINDLSSPLDAATSLSSSDLHGIFKNLVDHSTEFLEIASQEASYQNHNAEQPISDYLRSVYTYLRQLGFLISNCDPSRKDCINRGGYLDLINVPLSTTLGKLLLQDTVAPELVAKFTKRHGINILQLISQASVGDIPALGLPRETMLRGNLGVDGVWLLNPITNWEAPVRPAGSVAQELLAKFLKFLQDVQAEDGYVTLNDLPKVQSHPQFDELLESTQELAMVELSTLTTYEERLAFLINAANLLAIHGFLCKKLDANCDLSNVSQYFAARCRTSYNIGNGNQLSSIHLQTVVVGCDPFGAVLPHQLASLFSEQLFEDHLLPEPKALFAIVSCTIDSPKLQVFYPEKLEDQMNAAIMSYLDAYLIIKEEEKKVVFEIPQLFHRYHRSTTSKSLTETILKHSSAISTERLATLGKGTIDSSGEGTEDTSESISILPINTRPAVVLEYPGDVRQYDRTWKPRQKLHVHHTNLPPHVWKYLNDRCWLGAQVIDIISGNAAATEGCKALNEFIRQFSDVPAADLLVPLYYVNNLSIDLDDLVVKIESDDLESGGDDRKYEVLRKLFTAVERAVTIRPELLSMFIPLLDFIYCHLAAGSDNHGWRYARRIQNPSLQAQCVLALYASWRAEDCLEAFNFCTSDRITNKFLLKRLHDGIHRVANYHKIFTTVELNLQTRSWYSVSDLSNSNPEKLLKGILDQREFQLALDWGKLHKVPAGLQQIIEVSYLLSILDNSKPDTTTAQRVLEELADPAIARDICLQLLDSLTTLQSQAFVTQFVLTNLGNVLDEDQRQTLLTRGMGLKIFFTIHEGYRQEYRGVVQIPHIILEQLLMNMKMEIFTEALKSIKDDVLSIDGESRMNKSSVNKLLESYAKHAIDIGIVPAARIGSSRSFPNPVPELQMTGAFVLPPRPPAKENWVRDEDVAICMVCLMEHFSMFNRRHHCRRCGRVVCASCSPYRGLVDGYGDVTVRICLECYEAESGTISPAETTLSTSIPQEQNLLSATSVPSLPSNASSSSSLVTGSPSMRPPFQAKVSFAWQLTENVKHNATVREEFNYDHAPNVSLCLAMLDCHLDQDKSANYLLELCNTMFDKMEPLSPNMPNHEVDYSLLISITETLLLSAKMKFARAANNAGMDKCDVYRDRVDLVKLLTSANCLHLVPSGNIVSSDTIRRLRDKLLDEERWSLALEVTTKSGLDASGVWMSWAMLALKTGDFPSAREKFSHCFTKTLDRSQGSMQGNVLSSIVEYLEKHLYTSMGKVPTVADSLASLKFIRKQGIQAASVPVRHVPTLSAVVYEECLYYLKTYGSHIMLTLFQTKHHKRMSALRHILEKACEPNVFIEGVFMPSIRMGEMVQLEAELRQIDPTLVCWNKCLIASCQYLQKRGFYHVLYKVQVFMEDYLRAAATSVKLFSHKAVNYDELFHRLSLLKKALQHLKTCLSRPVEQQAPRTLWKVQRPAMQQQMPTAEINKYKSAVELQVKVTEFLHSHDPNTKFVPTEDESKTGELPTLFGDTYSKIQLAALVLIAATSVDAGFGISFKILKEFRLDSLRVFSLAGRTLVKRNRFDDIYRLVGCMRSVGEISPQIVDEVCASCILLLVREPTASKEIESLIKLITSDQHKINAYVLCGKLKSAYLLAVRGNQVTEVQRIMAASERSGQMAVKSICEKWLAQHGHS